MCNEIRRRAVAHRQRGTLGHPDTCTCLPTRRRPRDSPQRCSRRAVGVGVSLRSLRARGWTQCMSTSRVFELLGGGSTLRLVSRLGALRRNRYSTTVRVYTTANRQFLGTCTPLSPDRIYHASINRHAPTSSPISGALEHEAYQQATWPPGLIYSAHTCCGTVLAL